MAEKGGTEITWKKNNWQKRLLILTLISFSIYIPIGYFVWIIIEDIGFLFVYILIGSILPFAFLFTFINSPKAIGFSKKGIHGRYFRDYKTKYSKYEKKDLIHFSNHILWEEIDSLFKNNTYLIPSNNYPFNIGLYLITASKIFIIDSVSNNLLLEIANQFESYKHYKYKYDLNKNYSKYKDINDIPVKDVVY